MSDFYLLIAGTLGVSIASVFTMRNYQTTNAIEVVSNFTSTIAVTTSLVSQPFA